MGDGGGGDNGGDGGGGDHGGDDGGDGGGGDHGGGDDGGGGGVLTARFLSIYFLAFPQTSDVAVAPRYDHRETNRRGPEQNTKGTFSRLASAIEMHNYIIVCLLYVFP